MPSFETYILRFALRTLRLLRGKRVPSLETARRRFKRVGRFTPIHPEVKISRLGANGIPCEWIEPFNSSENKILVFLHGGGYTIGSLDSYRGWLTQLAYASHVPILAVAYQQAPEHPFPTAPSNALSAYEWVLEHHPNKQIFLMGDSAGGGLCLSIMLQMREEGISMPQSCFLISPWVDLEMKRDSIRRLAHRDFIMREKDLKMLVPLYTGKESPQNPFISPINADLAGFPPIYIHQGTEDLFLDEVKELYQKLLAANNLAKLEIWEGMPHVWHVMYGKLPEARKATEKIALLLNQA